MAIVAFAKRKKKKKDRAASRANTQPSSAYFSVRTRIILIMHRILRSVEHCPQRISAGAVEGDYIAFNVSVTRFGLEGVLRSQV